MYISQNILVVSPPSDITATNSKQLHVDLLSHTAASQLKGVVVDCSMITAADTAQARWIFVIAELCRLHQLSTVFCGIRGSVATALVELELDPIDIQTTISIDHALQKLGANNAKQTTPLYSD